MKFFRSISVVYLIVFKQSSWFELLSCVFMGVACYVCVCDIIKIKLLHITGASCS